MIALSELTKSFPSKSSQTDRTHAVDHVTLEIPEGKLVTFLGPSGCGKTTTLRMIAGLERPSGGRISIDGEDVFSAESGAFVPAHARPIGMVFQSYAIWPHMTVLENVAYPLRIQRGTKKADADRKAIELLDMVGLSALAGRPAPDLSGGQQQRVALARALVREPRVLLLDEPLSNLDAGLRDQMGAQLREVQRRLGITTIFVTHDQSEALAMSDLIVVMRDGRVIEQGSPRSIYTRPQQPFTAGFLGVSNVVPGTVESSDGDAIIIRSALGPISSTPRADLRAGDTVAGHLHPQSLELTATRQATSAWKATIEVAIYRGGHTDYEVRSGDQTLQVRVYRSDRSFEVGDEVWVSPCAPAALLTHQQAAADNR
jgi:ABC-type Fe3+/spermidine/putrescine transport system ATPase subunit